MPDIGLCAQLACVWEATARKPGNVHRFADFADVSYLDFLTSAAAISPVLASAPGRRIGQTALDAVRATQQVVRSNTNLGIILLLSPLAAVPEEERLSTGLSRLLAGADVEDARLVYEAIRLASPGGLGHVAQQDLTGSPTLPLRDVMRLARERDHIASEYTDDFSIVIGNVVPELIKGMKKLGSLEGAIVWCHLRLLARHGDTLILRKRGVEEFRETMERAASVLQAGWPTAPAGREAWADFDAWLRAEGHTRNPGTTADLVAASLFVALRTGTIQLPLTIPWSAGEIYV